MRSAAEQDPIYEFLSQFLSYLNREELTYCVLRNYDAMPYDVGNDIDMWVKNGQQQKFQEALFETALDELVAWKKIFERQTAVIPTPAGYLLVWDKRGKRYALPGAQEDELEDAVKAKLPGLSVKSSRKLGRYFSVSNRVTYHEVHRVRLEGLASKPHYLAFLTPNAVFPLAKPLVKEDSCQGHVLGILKKFKLVR